MSVCNAQKQLLFKSFTTVNGLPSNYILSVRQDVNGFIWVGTDKGLARFDGYKWSTWDAENGLPGNYIYLIEEDKHGGIWMSISTKGLFHFDGTKLVQYIKTRTDQYPIKRIVDADGNLFLMLKSGDSSQTKGVLLSRLNPSAGQEVFSFSGNPENFQVAPDEQKILFINYKDEQQAKASAHFSGKWKLQRSNYYFLPEDSIALPQTLFFLNYLRSYRVNKTSVNQGNLINYLSVFCNKNLFFTDKRNGFFMVEDSTVIHINAKDGIGTDYINDMSATKEGTLMVATLGKGLLFYNSNPVSKYVLDNAPIKKIIYANNGMYVLSGDKVYYQPLHSSAFNYTGISVPNSSSLYKKANSLYVSSYTGWNQYLINNAQLSFISKVAHGYGNSGLFITDSITYASTYGSGILRYKKNKYIGILNFPFEIIESLIPLDNGFAACSYENGVALWNCGDNTYRHLINKELLSNAVYSVFEDSPAERRGKNDLWISTRLGINHYLNGAVLQKLTYTNGFKGSYALYSFKDSVGRLWVLSDNYLHLKNGDKLLPIQSYQSDTDEKDVAISAGFNKEKQLLYIGTNKQLLIIDIWKIHPDTKAVTPDLITINVDGKKIYDENFSVDAAFNTMLFSFGPGASKIISGFESSYKLEGLDSNWHPLPDSLRISFSGLRPGKYTLLIQTSNPNGFISSAKIIAQFKVKPPFWATAWFVSLCILSGSVITGIIIWRVQLAKQRRLKNQYENEQKIIVEKQRISRDLHDNLGANLIHIISKIDNLQQNLSDDSKKGLREKAESLNEEARNSIQLLRETVWTIKEDKITLNDFVLRIRIYLQRILEEKKEITWDLNFTGNGETIISPEKSLHIFRIVQESVNNILRHAKATKIELNISNNLSAVTVIINDNGKGFKSNEHETNDHSGLKHMEYRTQQIGGSIKINSLPRQGTEIILIIPLNM